FNREKLNFLHRWWMVIDKKILSIFFIFILLSCVFVFSSSIPVAGRINVDDYFFFKHHVFFIILSVTTTIIISMFGENFAKKSIFPLFSCSLIILVIVHFYGFQTKGARRWLHIFGLSIQPTELIKPSLVLVNAYLLEKFQDTKNRNYLLISVVLYMLCSCLILRQPDIGTLALLTMIFFTQLFLLDFIDFRLCLYISLAVIFAIFAIYSCLPHVKNRVDNFVVGIKNSNSANYQVRMSLLGYRNSGIFGKGFMEGEIKKYIPDVHTDFIFPAIAEEFGFIFTFLMVLLYFYTAVRVMLKANKSDDQFKFFSLYGLSLLFLTQMVINAGVSLHLLPTKGITLPFLSYGGSSLLGTSINFGFLLVFTRKNFGFKHDIDGIAAVQIQNL
ncbi:MAG: FtsW/RodA/SpoVE family cell cycle protein, partial [Rickettsiales bacterium]|nr:FtsW/RodA/SpoVE family cell cycle protein [Rickettsiales bacterium]